MAVIALTSSMGTGVKYVAEQVAQRLGLNLVYREICEMARVAVTDSAQQAPQTPKSHWATGLMALHTQRQSAALADLEDLCRLVQRDNVLICGNTPLHFLSEVTHVVKVRVRTTMALRVRRIMACMNTDESDLALAKILLSEQRQADTLNRLFQIKDSESNELYDLVVDTGREPAENCALHIVGLASKRAQAAAGPSKSHLDTMAAQVRALRLGLMQNEADEQSNATSARRQGMDPGGLKLSALTCPTATQLFV